MERIGVNKYRGNKWRVDDRGGKFIGIFDTVEEANRAFGKAERIRIGFEKPEVKSEP